MAFQKVLLVGECIGPGEEKRLFPGLDVSQWDRLHFHISGGVGSVAGISVRILFGTPIQHDQVHCKALLADSTVWYEDTVWEREFSYITPGTYNGTGFVMSVPVIAPQLYDVILKNIGDRVLETVFVTVMAQEI